MNPLRLTALSLLLVAMSCSDSLAPQRQTTDLEAAHQRWRAQNLHTYAFTLQHHKPPCQAQRLVSGRAARVSSS